VLQDFFRAKRLRETASALNAPLREDALRTPEVCFAALADFPWQGHYVNNLPALNGLRMHYLDEWPPITTAATTASTAASRVFLCLHGHADWGYAFRHMLPLWCWGGHRVVVPDLVGFGKSDKPKRTAAHSLQFHQQTMVRLIERLDLRNIVLVMQDSAAALGQGLLLSAPERFVGTVRIHLQANEQDALGYACPYPDAGHKAALRASVFTAHGTANGHAATGQNQNSIGTALALHDLGDVPSHQAPQCAQTILTLFAAG
jgi:tRNA(adenine34) deaminase